MKKSLFSLIILMLYFQVKAQEIQLKTYIVREVTPDNKVISFIEVRDSVEAFLETIKELWGDQDNNNGKYQWNNVKIDSIEGNITVIAQTGQLRKNTFLQQSLPNKNKIKDSYVIRLQFIQGKNNLLNSHQTSTIIKNFIDDILNQIVAEENVDGEDN